MSVWVRTTVSVAPFQERFRQMEPGPPDGLHAVQPKDAATRIAERLGWRDRKGVLDGPRVRRALGLRCQSGVIRQTKNGPMYYPPKPRETVSYDMALRLCEAMDLDPMDVGL